MYDFEVGGLAVQVKTWAAFVNKEKTGQLKTQRKKNNQKEHGQWGSLVVCWLGLCTVTAEGPSLTPGWRKEKKVSQNLI